jgi:hypothetical protein
MKTGIKITVSGAFFDKAPPEVVNKHLRGAVSDVTDEGTREAKGIAAGFRRTGKYAGAIRGRVGKRLRGKVMVGAAAKKYRGYIERGAVRRGRVDKFKGHHTMSRSRQAIEPRVTPIIVKHVNRIVAELN